MSQFATTIFNAAFFAGLDFVEYQSHSLQFSRYPAGREATISWPEPDLVFENPIITTNRVANRLEGTVQSALNYVRKLENSASSWKSRASPAARNAGSRSTSVV